MSRSLALHPSTVYASVTSERLRLTARMIT